MSLYQMKISTFDCAKYLISAVIALKATGASTAQVIPINYCRTAPMLPKPIWLGCPGFTSRVRMYISKRQVFKSGLLIAFNLCKHSLISAALPTRHW
jgi:hypothetical protein